MRIYGYVTVLSLTLFGSSLAEEPTVGPLESVRYAELIEIIKQHKGKVVLIDFWGDFCLPCKREFPNFVQLHQKYAKSGLVAISVSLDDREAPETKGRVEKFLKAQKATTRNLWLNEKVDFWQQKLKIDGPPCVFLFDLEQPGQPLVKRRG